MDKVSFTIDKNPLQPHFLHLLLSIEQENTNHPLLVVTAVRSHNHNRTLTRRVANKVALT